MGISFDEKYTNKKKYAQNIVIKKVCYEEKNLAMKKFCDQKIMRRRKKLWKKYYDDFCYL